MPKKNDNLSYWEKREIDNLTVEMMKDAEVAEHIKNLCDEMFIVIQKEIESMYARYATKEGISMADAKKRISEFDVAEYEKIVAKYVREKDFSDEANKRLRLYNVTMRINREEYIKAMLNAHITALGSDIENKLSEYLDDATVRELKRQAGILGNISVERKDIKAIINSSHFGAVWSSRLWSNMDDVRGVVDRMVKDSIIRGRHPQEYVGELRKLTGRTEFEARRLLITEASRVQIEAQKLSYLETGVLKYKYKAIMDNRTTETCKDLNNKVFKVSDMRIGVNAPPMHAFCRSTTVPTTIDMDFDWKGKQGGILSIKDDEVVEDDAEDLADAENDAILDELDAMMARIDKLDNKKKKQAKKKIEAKVEKVTRQQPILNEKITSVLNDEQQKNIIDQFNRGEERAVELFNKFTQNANLLLDKKGLKASYHPGFKTVYLETNNLKEDSYDVGSTSYSQVFFHEFGHAIDNELGRSKYKNKVTKKRPLFECDFTLFYKNPKSKLTLSETAREDFYNYVKGVKEEHNISSDEEVYKIIKEIYKENNLTSVVMEDFLDGATFGKLFITYGHGEKYWKSKGIYGAKADMYGKEIFANLFALFVTSPKELELIKTIFPNTVEMFESIIEFALGVDENEE
ncbi:minor capsid protein [Macrococcus armenti]|uniref:minor capsid protein n=1 Tax=Macrococcus armenti TaxID=2875764 RepID=UPI001CCDAD0A|nr:minor capsid protein [Macrococcus armenti]UBH16395.1 minor capsid protein [Macrococcus armenti]UBH18751.1 minor capsid protein [Macrococcus armenti]UBH21023.1 minor capsid protein [Macrococcus armenti]